ncbi:hypothetical protein [Streptomyces sp. WMMC940]|uniref:hypothetical protein n=1 Tax=Streptomyces sp. WMMC940 TaxID=3015153 RepID=UPI0022B64665|nr:hypothetical protein [Streptomyces sp. WMMC940]MCZ7460426.1 hypothetical protein [Streptomyces sp. WMMC940]
MDRPRPRTAHDPGRPAGLHHRRAEEITDPALPLSFWGLLDEIHGTLPAAGRLEPALSAATLAQYALMEENR